MRTKNSVTKTSHRRFLTGLCILLWLTGCARPSNSTGLFDPPYEHATTDDVLRADEAWPGQEYDRQAKVKDNAQVPHITTDRSALIAPGIWQITLGDIWQSKVQRDTYGAVLALEEIEPTQERRVVYDPPLPLLPAELQPDTPVTVESNVQVYNAANGALETTGSVTATYILLGMKPASPDSPLIKQSVDKSQPRLYIVQTHRHYKLPLVNVDMQIFWAYQPGEGPVSGRLVRVVKLLGLLPIVHEQHIERIR